MTKGALVPTMVRLGMFAAWVLIISLFLWIPTFISYVTTQKSLTIFTWPLLLDPIRLKQFEQETGIKLYITYFENGPALLSKIEATGGSGYDLIIPDDHSLELLIKQGLVKKLDRTHMPFWNQLDPVLLGTYADPNNEYSVPYYWGVYGIGYNTDMFNQNTLPLSWSALFQKPACRQARICMTDDPREAVLITAQYLFGSIDALKDPDKREQVKQALIAQKKYVEVYTISRADTLLQSNSCGIAAIMSPELWRLARDRSNIAMIMPQEGTFVIMDSFAICCTSTKDAMIYQLINFLFRSEILTHHIESFGYCSPISSLVIPGQEQFCPIDRFKSFEFFRGVISDSQINDLWIEVLAA